jgi:hypothetical protein
MVAVLRIARPLEARGSAPAASPRATAWPARRPHSTRVLASITPGRRVSGRYPASIRGGEDELGAPAQHPRRPGAPGRCLLEGFANISFSDYEFAITFARIDHEVEEGDIPGVVVARVNMSTRFMKELIDAMQDSWSKWSAREGIRNLPEHPGDRQDSD